MNIETSQPAVMKGDILSRPECVLEAARTTIPKHIVKEILIFVLVFIINSVVSGIILVIPVLYALFSSDKFSELISAAMSGADSDKMTEIAAGLESVMGGWVLILTLFVTAVGIAAAVFYCVRIEKRRVFTMGFSGRGIFGEYATGLAAGASAFSLAVLICRLTGTLNITGLSATLSPVTLLLYFLGFAVQGMSEEALCRGYLMVSVSRRYTLPVAILASSLTFSMLHLLNSGLSWLAFVNLGLFGIFAAVYFIRRGSIWGIAAFHSVWNFAQGNFFGIRVSGASVGTSVLTSELSETGSLINGGEFGLEGGIAVTLVMLAGIAILYFMKPKKESGAPGPVPEKI